MRELNELEGVAVGIIGENAPCTAYTVRMALKSSPSSHWRASAGAIYPLLERLETEGLVRSVVDDNDGRGRKLLHVTRDGQTALKAWIKDIGRPDLIANVFDPIRSRIFFIDNLPLDEQIRFSETTLTALEGVLADAHRFLESRPAEAGLSAHLGAISGVISAQSRIDFMKTVQKALKAQQADADHKEC
jgi:DNA-binding PadR family transcriptional regulator